MKGLKIVDDELFCLIGDAILYEDDSYSRIDGDSINGFTINAPQNIEEIEENGWGCLYSSLEDNNKDYQAIAGETSWGGTGFVGLKSLKTNSFKWVLHLSTMNNPIKISIENDFVRVTTDLNYPFGLDFIIPIEKPERFKTEKPTVN